MKPKSFEEQIFFSTVRIAITPQSAPGMSIGTGALFAIGISEEPQRHALLLVSNKHVLRDRHARMQVSFLKRDAQGEPSLGRTATLDSLGIALRYYEHPDPDTDVACVNVSGIADPAHGLYYRTITEDAIATFDEALLVPGLEIWFVGYPQNRFDTVNQLPLMRRGYISSMPKVDFQGKPLFVIDAQVFPGSSGSPVFARIGQKFRLLGIISETMVTYGKVEVIPTSWEHAVQQTIGLGVVVKGTAVKELLRLAADDLRATSSGAA